MREEGSGAKVNQGIDDGVAGSEQHLKVKIGSESRILLELLLLFCVERFCYSPYFVYISTIKSFQK